MKKRKDPDKESALPFQSPIPFTQLPRSAGILLHITSLPSSFGIGDFGPCAYAFADFLHRSHQTVWQILPVNSCTPAQGFSPYSSDGSFSGNTLLISPELLAKENLVSKKDIAAYTIQGNKKTDYKKAQKIKTAFLDKAYKSYKSNVVSETDFTKFCQQENSWLHDYALYITLKENNENKPWNEWDVTFRDRDQKALQTFCDEHHEDLTKIKWQQWIFHKQWFQLKAYCNKLGIKILGDVSFYVAYDSADVWTHRHLFNLDKEGKMLSEGGAPPDDFNVEGQRWGMPVYCWDVIKKDKYKWWMNRMKKNIAMFDLVRLDHFRGFSAYWDIKKDAKSAQQGGWKPAPGADFFTLLQKEIGSLPFVAEDLGSIDEPVCKLRDQFSIPGMIIQQVAFGEDMPQSKAIPHHHTQNSVVYTGNHDNNTTLGWYKSLPAKLRKNISLYTNKKVTQSTICEVLQHLVYASVAKLAILPMQDILQLDSDSRMNSVSGGGKSWVWRMQATSINKKVEKYVRELCFLYDRAPAK